MSFKPDNYFEVTPIEVANNRSDDQNKKTATLIGLRRDIDFENQHYTGNYN